jgi:hypothetical protein
MGCSPRDVDGARGRLFGRTPEIFACRGDPAALGRTVIFEVDGADAGSAWLGGLPVSRSTVGCSGHANRLGACRGFPGPHS